MKDVRGIHAATVRNAIFKEFELQITNSKRNNVLEWKKSKKVKECYTKLYDNDDNTIENIAKYAFPNISNNNESFDNIYVYTAASVFQKNPDPTDQIRIRRIGSDRIYWMRIESGFGFEFDPIRRIRIKFGSIRKFLEPITSFFIKKKTFLGIF